jgi:hypothetical protein
VKGISVTEHQKELGRIKMDLQKNRRLFEEKDKEYRDLSRRYSELTNEYYKIVNSYGLDDQRTTKPHSLILIKSEKDIVSVSKRAQHKSKPNALENLLQEMVCSESETEEVLANKRGFASKAANIESSVLSTLRQREEE